MVRTYTHTGIMLVSLLLSSTGTNAWADGKWEFNTEDDGITLYTRDVDDSDYNEIKAVAVFDCTTDQIWAMLTEPETFVRLMPKVEKSKRIEECGENCYLVYQYLVIDGIDDRHYIIKVRHSITEKDDMRQYTRKWEIADRKPDPQDGVVTVEAVKGSWKLRSVDEGKKTKFVYQNFIDIGGSVPAFMANEASEDNAIQYLKNVRQECDERH